MEGKKIYFNIFNRELSSVVHLKNDKSNSKNYLFKSTPVRQEVSFLVVEINKLKFGTYHYINKITK